MTGLKRILLAEDNENDIELTLSALDEQKLANRVDVVRDGEDALDYLRCKGKYELRESGDPVVILLDLKMPKVDGLDVLRQIKSDVEMKHIPVVVLTSSRQEKDLVRSYNLGVNAYVVKPVGFDEFVAAIRELGMFWALLNEPPPNYVGKHSA
ncbi:MAG TPA: response regulator [Bacteroidota bacterium]|jgi:CheY-like chemotaxis protein|nr:response regulator [Bacteroidota bacterium]